MDVIDPRIEEYIERLSSPHEDLLAELSAETAGVLGMTQMLTGPVAGRFLELLVWFGRPQRVLEIGTFSGHSALAMAAALPEGGRIDACEIDPERAAFAQRYFDRSPHGSKITLHVGPALETIGGSTASSTSSSSTPTRRGTSATTRRCCRDSPSAG